MTTRELKQKYLKFFEEKGHKIIPGASLIPENDPTVLFTTAGMHPLVPFLLGEKHPAGDKLVSVQKCIRTSDIDEVGDDVHLTFFEMLGNWGLGSYWKKEAIEMSWEFLTSKKWLGLDKNKLAVSCFKGDKDAPKDSESAKIWQSVGIPKNRIYFFGKKDNFWGPAGQIGPCGPCTEMFYDEVEIWNDVFMEFNKQLKKDKIDEYNKLILENKPIPENFYEYLSLKQRNVDTGMGLERTVAVLNGKKSVFDVEPLKSIVEEVRKLAKTRDDKSERIIADHLRAATFILGDERGIVPSNVEQGYVVRKLMSRAIDAGREIKINKPFTHEIGELVINLMGDEYPELKKNKDFIIEQFSQEEERYLNLLSTASEMVGRTATGSTSIEEIPNLTFEQIGKDLFNARTAYGIPLDVAIEEMEKRGIKITESAKKVYEKEMQKHQELSRTATVGKFKSGLADHSEQVTKLHTATHLLLAALRQVLGNHIYQKGSNITAERLRLDFSYLEKMTSEQLKKVEGIVNEQIKRDLPVSCCEVSLEEAKKMGAMGVFESKYGDKVKVYTIGGDPLTGLGLAFSREICGGPHIKSIGELGHFKILKEESSSAGIRRIKAVLS